MPFGGHEWILVVEDDIDIRVTLVLFLQRHFYPTIAVANGVEALRILADRTKHLPSLIVMNLEMPVMDGTQLLNVIEISERLMGIPICIASGSVNTPVHNSNYHILHKPYSIDELLEIVQLVGVKQMSSVPAAPNL